MKNVTYINAGAGSGKTYTLIEKLSDLIIEGKVKPDQVILTTFTVKAANEFKEKAKARLYELGRFDDAIRLDQALIGTVHSICQQMIGKYWFRLGLAPNMGVMTEDASAYYISQSLADLPTEEELELLHSFCRNFNMQKFENFIPTGFDYDFWKKHLTDIISFATSYELDDFSESEERSIAFIQKFCEGISVNVTDEELNLMYNEARTYVGNSKRIKDKDKYYGQFDTAVRNKRDKSISWLKNLGKTFKYNYGDKCGIVSERLAGLWNSTEVYELQKSYIKLMFSLAKHWQENFAQFKREKNLLDYNDMEKYMRLLLNDNEVAAEIGRSYRYLFVDEFQDSSPIQVKIFDALSDLMEHSFWVGDSKQAIYGFRGSDIDMVNAVVENVTNEKEGCDTYSLDTCWRSLPDIVKVNNNVFLKTFKDVLTRDKISLNTKRENKSGEQSLRYIITDNEIDVADYIAGMVKNGIKLSDIAVLARYNHTLDEVSQSLQKKYCIPSNRGDISVVGTKTCMLIEALLNIVNSDKDLLAKAKVAMLTEKDLSTKQLIESKILFDYDENNKAKDFLADVGIIKRLMKIKPVLHQQSVATAIETMAIELGLFDIVKKLEDNPVWGMSYLQAIINTAKVYEEHSVQMALPSTIDGFISYLETVKPACIGDTNGVQLHTYHSCKGLQWKYVILMSLNNNVLDENAVVKNNIFGTHFARDNKPTQENPYPDVYIRLVPWIYDKKAPDSIVSKIDEEIYNETMKATRAEANRLLYVGMTRPRDVLILDVEKKKNGRPFKWFECVGLGSVSAEVVEDSKEWNALGVDYNFIRYSITGELSEFRYNDINESARILQIEQTTDNEDRPHRYVSPSELSGTGNATEVCNFGCRVNFANEPSDMAVVGDCIHQIFACCIGANTVDDNKVKEMLRDSGLSAVISDSGQIMKVWSNLTSYLSNTHGKALNIYHERPFRMERNGQTFVGSMDLVWQTESGDVLVDFKTCPMGPKAVMDTNSDHYVGRYAGQLDAYSAALSAAGEKIIARYIYYPISGLLVSVEKAK